jgi:carbon dioxide concentrating mechanism protein CcmM
LLPGVTVDGVSGAQVMGPDGPCSVWVGDRTTLAHKALVHGPAYIGKDCFIGFRSTIFNARISDGCVVMMHALVQDVELLPGKCVPSGSLITTQHQADQLPSVRPDDLEFAKEIMGAAFAGNSHAGRPISSPSRARLVPIGSRSDSPALAAQADAESRSHGTSYISPRSPEPASHSHRQPPPSHPSPSLNHPSYATGAAMQTQRLAPEIVQQVRQYLSSGYRIGMEHADARRYRSGVWETCTPIKDTHEQAVFSALERCLSEHGGEYVRMFGIDPQRKQRVGMVTVQRPDGRPVTLETKSVPASHSSSHSYSNGSNGQSSGSYSPSSNGSSGGLSPSVVQEVRNLLRGGYVIGTEHADARRYRSNVWKVCSPIKSDREQEVFARLEHCLDEHSGEYVRMFGIDPKANRRTANITIQRADGKPVQATPSRMAASAQPYGAHENYSHKGSHNGDSSGVLQAVSQILRQGNQVGIEYADARRFRSGIWQTAPTLQARNDSGAMSELQSFLNENTDKYVRVFGINKALKTRSAATTIQKPGQKSDPSSDQRNAQPSGGSSRDPINGNPPHYDDPAYLRGGAVDASVTNQVTQLINQGCHIAVEFADKRRFRSGIWQTGPAINARRPAEAIDALSQQLAQNPDSYVRLVGIDPKAKRRVLEFTIQKPGQVHSPQSSGGSRDPINANPPHYDDPSYLRSGTGRQSTAQSRGSNGNGAVDSSVMDQVTQLVNQGCHIAVEFADKRRFRSGIWQTGAAIDARRPAEAISALGKQLAQHSGDYVRLVGIDPKAKRRVLETTIQRP